MREIKFRVYDSISKTMHNWEYIKHMSLTFFDLEHYTLEQFTGLKDKNGVDIYEGDVFYINNRTFKVEFIEDSCRYVLTTGKGYDTRNCIDLTCDTIFYHEVIRNIHENKELKK